jgi:acetyl esterase
VNVAPLDRRVQMLGWMLRRLPASALQALTPSAIRDPRAGRSRLNPLTGVFFGRLPPGLAVTNLRSPGPEEDLVVRVYRRAAASPTARPLVVNYHGDAWTPGHLDMADWLCGHVAKALDAVVVSVGYRRAPADPFPAALDDCYAGLEWAAEHAGDLGADAGRLAVMGDGTGGGLAAVVCLLARDHAGPAIAHQALLYPSTDLVLDGHPAGIGKAEPVLTLADMLAYRDGYLGAHGTAADWRVSPLHAGDHTGLPPALVQTAQHDLLREDGVRYADALSRAGVPVRLTEYAGAPHGYLSLPGLCRAATQALAELTAEQARALAP